MLGAKFKHPSRDVLSLNDIFIYPDVQTFERNRNFSTKFRADKILEQTNFACISGAEDSGKSTLKQKLALDLRLAGYYPVVVSMVDLKSTKSEDIVNFFYKKLGMESYLEEHDKESKYFLLVDDYSEDNLSSAKAERLFSSVNLYFSGVYLFGHESSFFGTVFNKYLSDFTRYTIQQFGYVLRSQLFERWYRLAGDSGVDVDESEILKKIDAISKHFNIIQDRKLVENKPLYNL